MFSFFFFNQIEKYLKHDFLVFCFTGESRPNEKMFIFLTELFCFDVWDQLLGC